MIVGVYRSYKDEEGIWLRYTTRIETKSLEPTDITLRECDE